MDLSKIKYISFDCYGTLIDWETGILAAFERLLGPRGLGVSREEVLSFYAQAETTAEQGTFRHYREVLADVVRMAGMKWGFEPGENELGVLAESVGTWEPFSDTRAALARLSGFKPLVLLSNVDVDMMAQTRTKLGVRLHRVFTAQEIGHYKPSLQNFYYLLDQLGVGPGEVLHVAQSKFHDIVPARSLGMATVWISRGAEEGVAAVPEAEVEADFSFEDLRGMADWWAEWEGVK